MTPETSPDAARSYAIQMHGDQKYGVHPYVHHLDAVVALLRPYGEQAQVVGFLHDVVEDTDATVADIAERFGTLVAGCVALLSDAPGANRKERKARTYAASDRSAMPARSAPSKPLWISCGTRYIIRL